jgi:hypothetical protein
MSIPIEPIRVRGCTCRGSGRWHEPTCGLFGLPADEHQAAVEEAMQRMSVRAEEVTRGLNAFLAGVLPENAQRNGNWPPPQPLTDDQIREALVDPRNRDQVAEVLRREARINPSWLAEFIRAEERRSGPGSIR